jgi:hypothetical protein
VRLHGVSQVLRKSSGLADPDAILYIRPCRGLMIFWCADARCHAVARQLYHSPQFRSQFCFPDRNVPMWGVGSRQDSQALLHEAGHYKQMAPNRPSLPRRQRNRSSLVSRISSDSGTASPTTDRSMRYPLFV